MNRTALLIATTALLACSPAAKPVEPEPVATAAPEPTPPATADPVVEPPPTATAEAPPASTLPPPSGRPPMRVDKSEKITETFGASPEAKLYLGGDSNVFMRIPEYAIGDAMLITLMFDKKAKRAKGGQGETLRLYGQVPPTEEYRTVTSRGPKFELKIPNAKGKAPNLAIGEAKKDDKGKDTIEWRVIAPIKTDGDFSIFELTEFTNATLQATSEAPTP